MPHALQSSKTLFMTGERVDSHASNVHVFTYETPVQYTTWSALQCSTAVHMSHALCRYPKPS